MGKKYFNQGVLLMYYFLCPHVVIKGLLASFVRSMVPSLSDFSVTFKRPRGFQLQYITVHYRVLSAEWRIYFYWCWIKLQGLHNVSSLMITKFSWNYWGMNKISISAQIIQRGEPKWWVKTVCQNIYFSIESYEIKIGVNQSVIY